MWQWHVSYRSSLLLGDITGLKLSWWPIPGQSFPSSKKLWHVLLWAGAGGVWRGQDREVLQRPLHTSHICTPCKSEHLSISLTAFTSGRLVLARESWATTCTTTGNDIRTWSSFSHFYSQNNREETSQNQNMPSTPRFWREKGTMKVQTPFHWRLQQYPGLFKENRRQCVGTEWGEKWSEMLGMERGSCRTSWVIVRIVSLIHHEIESLWKVLHITLMWSEMFLKYHFDFCVENGLGARMEQEDS